MDMKDGYFQSEISTKAETRQKDVFDEYINLHNFPLSYIFYFEELYWKQDVSPSQRYARIKRKASSPVPPRADRDENNARKRANIISTARFIE